MLHEQRDDSRDVVVGEVDFCPLVARRLAPEGAHQNCGLDRLKRLDVRLEAVEVGFQGAQDLSPLGVVARLAQAIPVGECRLERRL